MKHGTLYGWHTFVSHLIMTETGWMDEKNTNMVHSVSSSSTHRLIGRQRTKVTNHIIHRYADRECHTTINASSIHLLGEELLCLRVNDRVSKFTQIQDTGSRYALRHQSLQGQIHNLGGLLVFRANITAKDGRVVCMCM